MMTRIAYVWVLGTVVFAFWFHSHEETERRKDIRAATEMGLYAGTKAGCKANNRIRLDVVTLAQRLHPEVAVDPELQNCHRYATKVVRVYIDRVAR